VSIPGKGSSSFANTCRLSRTESIWKVSFPFLEGQEISRRPH
jgi:hypothetical protein